MNSTFVDDGESSQDKENVLNNAAFVTTLSPVLSAAAAAKEKQTSFSPPLLTNFDDLLERSTLQLFDNSLANNPGGSSINVTLETENPTSKRRKVTVPKSKRELFPDPEFTPLDRDSEFILPDVGELVLPRKRRLVRGPAGELVHFGYEERHGEMPCIICDKVYVCRKFLQRHKVAKHRLCKPVHQLDCAHCGALFADVDSFKRHCEETELQIKEFYEKGLHEKTVQKRNSVKHTNTRKLALLEKRMSQRELKLKVKEDEEEKAEAEMQLAVVKDEQEEMFTCDICVYVVGNLETIRAHVAAEHSVDNEAQMEVRISPFQLLDNAAADS